METSDKAIEVRNLWYRYEGSQDWVLKNISFSINRGETVALVGPFGCGKTTLFRVLTGIARKVYRGVLKGEIRIFGKRVDDYNSKELTRCIGILFQNPILQFIEYVVEDDLYSFAEEYYKDHVYIEKQIKTVLEFFNVDSFRKKRVFELSGGELRRVAIAKLMLLKPCIILMDEPLLWLDHNGVENFTKLLNLLKSFGLTILISEHRILPILPVIDKIMIMDNGRIIATRNLRHIFSFKEKYMEVNKLLTKIRSFSPETISKMYGARNKESKSVVKLELRELHDLYIEDLWFRYGKKDKWVLKNVDLKGIIGDLIVILGNNGSGKTTLLKLIAGLLKPTRGTILIMGEKPRKKRQEIFLVPQVYHVSFSEETVFDEIANLVCKNRDRECRSKVVNILSKYGLQEKIDESPYNLSWGQQLLLNIILAIMSRRGIVLFDEPTTGLSYADKITIAQAIRDMCSLRIVVTHDIDFAVLLRPNKLYVLHDGVLKPLDVERFIEDNTPLVKLSYEFLRKIVGEKIVGDIGVLDST